MREFIPVSTPYLSGKEKEYLCDAIDSGWVSSEGPYVKKFENQFASMCNRRFGVSCSSGSSALNLAIKTLNLNEGDEVILPNFTIISCAQAIINVGAVPVFVDCDERTFNMNIDQIEGLITKKTKAIMGVHIYGLTTDMPKIVKIAQKYNLKVIEDAAQAHGQKIDTKPCGSFGDISIFSFYANKHITTGEGGMILTDTKEFYERANYLKNLCFDNNKRFVHEELGDNFRMTNLQAAVGVAQLESLDFVIKRKKEVALKYFECLKSINSIRLPLKKIERSENHFWVFPIIFEKHEASSVLQKLNEKKIGTRPFFYPLSKQPALKDINGKGQSLEVSEGLYDRGLYIPCDANITDEEIKYICDSIKEVVS